MPAPCHYQQVRLSICCGTNKLVPGFDCVLGVKLKGRACMHACMQARWPGIGRECATGESLRLLLRQLGL